MKTLDRAALAIVMAVFCTVATPVHGQQADSALLVRLREGLPLKPERILRFTTREGSWMSVDVSPDGRTLVFDLLGDLYTMPIEGGKATPLTQGMALDAQPRFSPDGTRVLFTSDRSGGEGVWTMSLDKRDTLQVTRGKDAGYLTPEWAPDGKFIVVSRAPTRGGSTMVPKLWLYHARGGSGAQLTREPETARMSSAAFGPNGRYLWYEERTQNWIYSTKLSDYQLVVFDRETGQRTTRTSQYGSAMRPTLSPDGNYLVYATRHDANTGLVVRDLRNGNERWLAYPVQRDDQESRAALAAYPGMSFTPDSKHVVASWGGKLWRVPVDGGVPAEIPFEVDVQLAMAPRVQFDFPVADSATFIVKQIENATTSPDGRRIAFTALDKLYVVDAAGGAPRRVTRGTGGEFYPSWSPDGQWLAFSSWSDTDGGHINKVRIAGGDPVRLTRQPAIYVRPVWSPDGARLVALRGSARTFARAVGNGPDQDVTDLIWVPANGGEAEFISHANFGNIHFGPDRERIYASSGGRGLISMRWDGTDVREHLKVTGTQVPGANAAPNAGLIRISPLGEEALAQLGNDVYVVTIPITGATPTISVSDPANSAFPARKLSEVGAQFPSWSADGNRVHWSIGNAFFTYDLPRARALEDSLARVARAPRDTTVRRDTTAARRYEPTEQRFRIALPRDIPSGSAVLRGARVVTMRGDEVIENGDVVIRDNRIVAVGRTGSVTVPDGANVIDVTGKTIVPGYVDTHAHMWPMFGTHRDPWMYLVNLAFGVTTTRDPQTASTDVLTYSDRVQAGEVLGPRIYSTGPGIFFGEQLKNLDHTKRVLRRYSDYYDTKTLKQYAVGNREQRQWLIQAAREMKLMSTTEGSLDIAMNLTEAFDGYSGHEHSYPIFPMYSDWEKVFAESKIAYTPTLVVAYGAPFGQEYWYATENVHDDARLRYFTPHEEVDRKSLRRGIYPHAQSAGWFHEIAHGFKGLAKETNDILKAGGRIGIGSHGELQGLGYHWELWSVASGGMSNHDALRAATIMGADAIGLSKDVGSIEAGKLADLVVLDGNPLQNLRASKEVRYVMKNGRLYEGATLNEIYPRKKPLPPQWWHTGDPVTP